ncbi:GNAT family N-acetyltransferase [Rhodococcus sp. C3V]|uniref:GNAT family N-acetyltransferase n=1 Tax=Rhodococcus sp. C3V TaxID=3034165 RepID=UPI0023E251D5|nr:GNAT family N-acetyltransferase [Rhodococcus sp. C3V]MDF3319817.1 GNAT family N-acetyltransferase [Rhodococcus sp. C3V]
MNPAAPYTLIPRYRPNGTLVDISPPPTEFVRDEFTFRVVSGSDDIATVHEWMNRPHNAETWGYDWPVERWSNHIAAQLDTNYSRPIIVTVDGADVAYMEFYRPSQDIIGEFYECDPHDLGLHIAIADIESSPKGRGSRLMSVVVDEFFSYDPNCKAVAFEPDASNIAVRKAVLKTGSTFIGEIPIPNREIALYLTPRPGTSLTETRRGY